MSNGRRFTSAHNLNHKSSKGLVIHSNTVVEKVLLRANYEAYGVKYTYLDDTYYARAKKGVILSAGAIGTPKILLLSGIGPKKHLKSIGITPKIDLPVGENLQDHVTTGFDLVLLNQSLGLGIEEMMSPFSMWSYFINGKGPWTTAGCENVAFFAPETEKVPDLQFMVLPIGVSTDNCTHLHSLVNIGEQTCKDYFGRIEAEAAVSILPIVLHPKSRGSVTLKDKNPETYPVINPNYLIHKDDIEIILKGIEIIKNLIATKPMKKFGSKLNENIFPGCEEFSFDTRPYWECYIRHLTITSYHPVGTCSLGMVVNDDFQVKGTNKLYVVDGSILPELPSGNPNAAIMMLAEKAADVIKYHQFLSTKTCRVTDCFC